MTRRIREVVGVSTRPCGLCGGFDVDVVRSCTQGSLLERVLRKVDPDERFTAACRSCGSRTPIAAWPTRPHAATRSS